MTTRDNAVFEYFRITAGAPDSAAPTSAATTAGTGPVTVTVTGADEAGGSGLDKLEYRLDGGAWTTVHDAGRGDGGRGAHARAPRDRQGRQRRHGRAA